MPDLSPDAWTQIRYAYEHTDRPVEDICAAHGISSGRLRDRVRRWRWRRRRTPIPRQGPSPVARIARQPLAVAAWGTMPPSPTLALSGGGSESAVRFVDPLPLAEGAGDAETGFGLDDFRASPVQPTPTVFAAAQTVDPPPPGQGRGDDADPAAIVPRLQSAAARVLPAIEATIARLAAGPHQAREMEQAGRALSALTRTLRELNALLGQHHARGADEWDDDMPEDIDAFRHELARRIEAFVASRTAEDEEAKAPET